MPTTPYISLTLPAVSMTLGPEWATEINDAITAIDAHDHSSGHGQPVRPAGIYMDADLNFRGVNAYAVRSARFQLQSSLLGGVDDVSCIYFKGADLYANDAAGNQIQITSGGGVVGTPGSISGLASPASVVYTPASKIFNFYSDSLVRAALACGPLTIAEAVASGKGVTISVPASLTSNYALELPGALPATTGLLSLSPSGAIAVDSGHLELSATSGYYHSTGDTSIHDVTNLSVSFTTNGRPIKIGIQSDGGGSILASIIRETGGYSGFLILYRDSTVVAVYPVYASSFMPGSAFEVVEKPSAGTYTYKVSVLGTNALTNIYVEYCKLAVVQL